MFQSNAFQTNTFQSLNEAAFQPTGGIVFGGNATATVNDVVLTFDGVLFGGGASVLATSANEATGGTVAGGASISAVLVVFESSGGLAVSANAEIFVTAVHATAGGIAISGAAGQWWNHVWPPPAIVNFEYNPLAPAVEGMALAKPTQTTSINGPELKQSKLQRISPMLWQ